MYRKALTAALAVFVALTAGACGGGGDAPSTGGTTPAPAGAVDPSSIADPGTINGSISFGGDAPQPQVLQMAADPFCVTANAGVDVLAQRLVVNDNGTLRNVFVYVKEGLDQSFTTSGGAVTLGQENCMYSPHMVGLQTNQTLTIVNNDAALHNVNAQPTADGNDPFNFAQPVQGMTNDVSFGAAEIIPVKCDVHPWMSAYIGVADHPFFAVTGADGSFTIGGLPAGDYVIAAWHETLGEQEESVSVAANGTAEVAFEFGS